MNVELRRQPNAGSTWVWVVAWVVFVLIAAAVLSIMFWCWLRDGESGSTTIRNLGLVVVAVIALPLAIWRSIVAERQAKIAERQADTAQRGLLNERYQKGAEMLGSGVLAVRLGGIYALAGLAREHPGDYHLEIVRLFCAFVRNPTGEPAKPPLPKNGLTGRAEFNSGFEEDDEDSEDHPLRVREDVQAVMAALRKRCEAQIKIEENEGYPLDLSGSNLKGVRLISDNLKSARLDVMLARLLEGTNLSGAIMIDANLSDAVIPISNLSGANLRGAIMTAANLGGTDLSGANLSRADLTEADLSDADLRKCKGLTQEQIDQAVVQEGFPPNLTGVVDANTGEQLKWLGGTPDG